MIISLIDSLVLGPILLIILIIETIFLKKHYIKYICAYIGINFIPIIGLIVKQMYVAKYMIEGWGVAPLRAIIIFLAIVNIYLYLVIYFTIKIIIKLIRKEKLKE